MTPEKAVDPATGNGIMSSTATSPLLMLAYLLYAIVWVLTYLTLVRFVLHRTEKPQLADAFKSSSARVLPYIGVSLLVGFTVGGAAVFLVIPAIIVMLMTIIAPYIVIEEKIGGMEALIRSYAYARGRLRGIFGRLLFLIIPAIPVVIILSLLGKYSTVVDPLCNTVYLIYVMLMYENLKALRPDVDSKKGGKTGIIFIIFAVIGPLLIIGSVVFLLALNPASLLEKSRDTTRKAQVMQLTQSVEAYYLENGILPQSLSELETVNGQALKDPKTLQEYEYVMNGDEYQICATLESKDPDANADNIYCLPQAKEL